MKEFIPSPAQIVRTIFAVVIGAAILNFVGWGDFLWDPVGTVRNKTGV